MNTPTPYVAYYRVSTNAQGESGLGLDAQKREMLAKIGYPPVREFTDIISGTRRKLHKRKEVAEAISYCAVNKLPLVSHNVSRFARDRVFLQQILTSKVKLVFCDGDVRELDKPYSLQDEMIVMLKGYLAEMEAKEISNRCKYTCDSRKARGEILGRQPAGKTLTHTIPLPKEEYMKGALATARLYWTDTKQRVYDTLVQLRSKNMDYPAIRTELTHLGLPDIKPYKLKHIESIGRRLEV